MLITFNNKLSYDTEKKYFINNEDKLEYENLSSVGKVIFIPKFPSDSDTYSFTSYIMFKNSTDTSVFTICEKIYRCKFDIDGEVASRLEYSMPGNKRKKIDFSYVEYFTNNDSAVFGGRRPKESFGVDAVDLICKGENLYHYINSILNEGETFFDQAKNFFTNDANKKIAFGQVRSLDVSGLEFLFFLHHFVKDHEKQKKLIDTFVDNIITMFPNTRILLFKPISGFNDGLLTLDLGMKMELQAKVNCDPDNKVHKVLEYFFKRTLENLPNIELIAVDFNQENQARYLPKFKEHFKRGLSVGDNKVPNSFSDTIIKFKP